ncbi:hypothetical protein LTR64_007283 [Lithohypha guttulata]|uniref:uncharacterized protein n=1 Tax=Lithohypha guttulata TaxID=1690604 RepID=UPI00315D75FE
MYSFAELGHPSPETFRSQPMSVEMEAKLKAHEQAQTDAWLKEKPLDRPKRPTKPRPQQATKQSSKSLLDPYKIPFISSDSEREPIFPHVNALTPHTEPKKFYDLGHSTIILPDSAQINANGGLFLLVSDVDTTWHARLNLLSNYSLSSTVDKGKTWRHYATSQKSTDIVNLQQKREKLERPEYLMKQSGINWKSLLGGDAKAKLLDKMQEQQKADDWAELAMQEVKAKLNSCLKIEAKLIEIQSREQEVERKERVFKEGQERARADPSRKASWDRIMGIWSFNG